MILYLSLLTALNGSNNFWRGMVNTWNWLKPNHHSQVKLVQSHDTIHAARYQYLHCPSHLVSFQKLLEKGEEKMMISHLLKSSYQSCVKRNILKEIRKARIIYWMQRWMRWKQRKRGVGRSLYSAGVHILTKWLIYFNIMSVISL